MKALSVRAPWWWAIIHGKPVENRDWSTKFRGRFLLHASKWWNRTEIDFDYESIRAMVRKDGLNWPDPSFSLLREAGGLIVGSVDIVDCVTKHPSAFFQGKFGFVLADPIIFSKPIPFKGALGFFDVPDDFLARN